MVESASRFPAADGLQRRGLNQCARQLMLAQSSDWPFLMSAGTADGYATKRFEELMTRFHRLLEQVSADQIEPALLQRYEWLDDPFAEMDYTVFCPV